MVKINDEELVDMKTFLKVVEELKTEINKLKLMVNPISREEFKKLGIETVDIKRLRGEKEKTPIEELLEEE